MLNAQSVARIESAIADVELHSRAELIAVLARRAGHPYATGLALASAASFAGGALVWFLLPWATGGEVLLAQAGIFPLVFAVVELSGIGDRLTPGAIKIRAASRLARATFLEQGLAAAPERNAILFFVSLGERYVEIIADAGIHSRVGSAEWQRIIDMFSQEVRGGAVERGFIDAIAALGEQLAQHFPAGNESANGRPNSLPNRLIMLS